MAIGLPGEPVQVALLTLLWTDATLVSLTGAHPTESGKARVYDEPPQGAAFPYLQIGEVVERDNNRMGGKVGHTLDVFVHAVSDDRGYKQVRGLLDRVNVLLDNKAATFSVTGYSTELLNFRDRVFVKTARAGTPLREGISRYELHVVEA